MSNLIPTSALFWYYDCVHMCMYLRGLLQVDFYNAMLYDFMFLPVYPCTMETRLGVWGDGGMWHPQYCISLLPPLFLRSSAEDRRTFPLSNPALRRPEEWVGVWS